jgi:hypothetical protein
MLLDLAVMGTAITATGVVVWAIARVASGFHLGFLFLLVILPWVGSLSWLLRRHCYPNTRVWRASTISALDAVPAPIGRKLYVTLLSAAYLAVTMLLAYVLLSRTWYAVRFGAPQTSLAYDLLHPWSVAPLFQKPVPGPKAGGGPPTLIAWWIFPGLGLVLSLAALGWCGTLETNTRRDWAGATPGQHQQDLSWARVAAILALLLFWLPVLGLVAGGLAFWLNRRSPTWTYRAGQLGLLLAGLVHAGIAVLVLVAVLDG